VLRHGLLLISLALLGCAGAASAKLVAAPAPTDPLATGPGAAPPLATTTTAVPASTRAVTTTRAATTTIAATTMPAPAAATSTAATTLVFNGHGWGHGMGMSQWGANGYAQHGWDYRQILAHYYQRTTVAAGPQPVVRVLLAGGRTRVTLASGAAWKVADANGATITLPAGRLQLTAGLAVAGKALVSPLTFTAGTAALQLGKAAYRGRLLVLSNGKRLQVVNALPLDSYVLGVVGMEMPSSWPAAALEAQAVAARSYALAELENVVTARAFDLYADTRSQVYGGIAAESAAVTAAVRATARQVVLYGGKVATTYFSSSSGGRTVSAAEALGKAVPYLVSVDDPYDALSPYHDWGPVLVDARKAAHALKVPGDLIGFESTTGPSNHVTQVDAVGSGGDVRVTGAGVRAALGLRSTWFSVAWLALVPPAAPVPYGGAATLTGTVRNLSSVSLEQRPAGGEWQPAAAVTPAADGSFSVTVHPAATTQYRLAAGPVLAGLVSVEVTPAVSAAAATGAVQGSVKPALAGAAVQLQRQDGTSWTTVATGKTDVAGSFAVAAQLAPGSYRVRCVPGHGLSPGVSQPILQT
jgi:SpoIID/LytB domain protein